MTMNLRRILLSAAGSLLALALHAQQPTSAAFLVGEEKGGRVILSAVMTVDADLSNEAIMARFGKLPATVPVGRWSVVRNTSEDGARKALAELEAKYRASGRMVKPLK